MNTRLTTVTLSITAGLLAFSCSPAFAQGETFEPPFEVNSTNAIGDVGVRATFQGFDSSDGSQLLLTTINDNDANGDNLAPRSGTDAVDGSSLSSFVGVTNGTIRNGGTGSDAGTEGSAFRLTINLGVGNVLTFDFQFLTQEDNAVSGFHNDFAFASLTLGGVLQNYAVLDTAQNANAFAPDQGDANPGPFTYAGNAGVFTFTATQAGTYTLGIGVADAVTRDIASALLVDNITVVPEPSTYALLAGGALLLLGWKRKRSADRS